MVRHKRHAFFLNNVEIVSFYKVSAASLGAFDISGPVKQAGLSLSGMQAKAKGIAKAVASAGTPLKSVCF
jgi:hypothetical protein